MRESSLPRASGRGRIARALLLGALLCATLALPARASAASDPREMLIYMPYGLIHSVRPDEQVDGYLAEVASYGIGQFVFAMPKFKKLGVLKVPKPNRQMLPRWSARAEAYDAAHGADLSLTAVYNGKVRTRSAGLDLEDPLTRANVVAGVESTLGLGIAGVQFDLEPYPSSPGFISLLEEVDAMFARVGFHGRLSVAAPASTSRWSAAYLNRVSQLVGQLDPLYYDSEYKSISAYEQWMRSSLAYYAANSAPGTRIVPILPSYSANRWHAPSVENVGTATAALSGALGEGSRIDGAGIWSGWGFLLDEEGAYDGSGDRSAWQTSTLGLPFSP